MTQNNLSRRAFISMAAVKAGAAVTTVTTSAMAGKAVFERTKPHVNVGSKPARQRGMKLTGGGGGTARKWCGPGGRLCIENGRWTWKKKKKK